MRAGGKSFCLTERIGLRQRSRVNLPSNCKMASVYIGVFFSVAQFRPAHSVFCLLTASPPASGTPIPQQRQEDRTAGEPHLPQHIDVRQPGPVADAGTNKSSPGIVCDLMNSETLISHPLPLLGGGGG